MAWPALTANDVMPGEPVSEAADTVGQQLFDRDVMVLNKGTTYAFDDNTTASTSPVQIATKQVRIPDAMESGDFIFCYVETWNSGANNTTVYLYDLGTTTLGPGLINSNGTTHEWKKPGLTLGAWGGTFRTIEVWGKAAAGTSSFSGADCLANLWFVAQ